KGLPPLKSRPKNRKMRRFCRKRRLADERILINPSANCLGGLWRSWRISEKIRLSRQVALERSSTG
ncbi:MAG TPA: hypothetical protein VGY66_05665, partial [Gemmataceae bacterium]|nr:hypothetical protein [Gemmataceae bacterium]